jgi:hypothetical protein
MARKSPAKTVKKLDPDQLARREGIFCIYRDLGATRSYDRLMAVIKDSHGEVSRRTLTNWSRQHSWQERTAEHDRDLQIGSQGRSVALDANFDQKDALLRTAHLALQRALESTPVVRTAQDLKALVDAANTAIKLTELLNAGERGRPDRGARSCGAPSRTTGHRGTSCAESPVAAAARGEPGAPAAGITSW